MEISRNNYMLPNRWYAHINKNNRDLIQKWREDKFNLTQSIPNDNYIYSDGLTSIMSPEVIGKEGWQINNEILLTHVLKHYFKSDPINNSEDLSYLNDFLNKIKL